jgi:hypothetical protein
LTSGGLELSVTDPSVEALWRLRIVCQLAVEIGGGVLLPEAMPL